MSHAPVGQRSAHRPQCRQTSSSFTITRPVFTGSDTYKSCSAFSAGAVRRVRSSGSSPSAVKVMQSIGHTSTQASHSMHRSFENTVCTSQFKHRCASFHAVWTSNPSSTSWWMFVSVFSLGAHGKDAHEHPPGGGTRVRRPDRVEGSAAVFELRRADGVLEGPVHRMRRLRRRVSDGLHHLHGRWR